MSLIYHPLYEKYNKKNENKRSSSPLPPLSEEVTNMSPQELEQKLNVTIPKWEWGWGWGSGYIEREVDIARRIFEETKPKSESPESRVFIPSDNSPINKPYSPSDFRSPQYTPASEAAAAKAAEAKAAEAKAKLPQNHITQADIDAARREVDELWIRRVYGFNLLPDYPERSFDHDISQKMLQQMLQQMFAKQRKTGPKGGKSKRVKSKRNKRSTKRRNARK